MFDDFISADSAPLYKSRDSGSKECYLLWGDGVRFLGDDTDNSRRRVRARGRKGWVSKSNLGGESLLEYYFIDVGQGDGVLIKTPDFRHIMIDGGYPRRRQETGKNAADFVDWKFYRDYGMDTIELDVLAASHCDADHYGGLWNLLDVEEEEELDADRVRVETICHAGLSRWEENGGETLGDYETVDGETYWTTLLGDRDHAESVTGHGDGKLKGWWGSFIETALKAKTKSGDPTPISRLSDRDEFLPGFAPDGSGSPTVKILGPVEFDINGKPAVRRFAGGNESQNKNGVSLLLRMDYGKTRVLLTGDLNKLSQQALLRDYEGRRMEFLCDVAKACHHGSEDISYKFLQAMQPAATVISSGDNEGYDHPRPSIIAASATTGYMEIDRENDDLLTPLIYSTELGRSVDLGHPKKLEERGTDGSVTNTLSGAPLHRSRMHLSRAKWDRVYLGSAMVVGGLIYGLINVRTDGDKILCATLDEKRDDWRIKTFHSRF